jgi:xanthine dehydrogenase YagT iron-sulfur-binding subunit
MRPSWDAGCVPFPSFESGSRVGLCHAIQALHGEYNLRRKSAPEAAGHAYPEVCMKKKDDENRRTRPPDAQAGGDHGFSRRDFIKTTGAAVSAGVVGAGAAELLNAQAPAASGKVQGPGEVSFALRVNGQERMLKAEPRVTLLDALRDTLDLTGAKKVCDRGTCGACTVLLDGKAVYACTVLAIDAQGRDITTIEGLAPEGELHAVSAAFVDNDAQQCGFCTPGFVMACKAYLDRNPNPSEAQVNRALGGNICRCGTYVGVRAAALDAARRLKGGRS